MIRYNTDCPYCHDIFDQYCNLFKDYKNCDKCDCEVLKILKENEQLKLEKCELLGIIQKKDELIEKMKRCGNCKHHLRDCQNSLICVNNNHKDWELAE